MKKYFVIVTLLLVFLLFAEKKAQADSGPFYVYYNDFCNVKEVYVNQEDTVYGLEVGCSDSLGSIVGGSLTANGATLSYPSDTLMIIDVFNMGDSSLFGYGNSGTSLELFGSTTWFIGPAPTAEALKSLQNLPSWH